ncbi:sensor histidine kinase [Streptomyces antimycoticus]|uniref:sensor histidine kinase n=1 Tax=Streptomyces antimycoticus TaxID=68175 RepID=UPI00386473EE|nr:histidine kinase [Streptomyces antimycoticus]
MDRHLRTAPHVKRLITVSGLFAFALTWLADIALVRNDSLTFGIPWLPVVATGPLIALAVAQTSWSPSLGMCVATAVSSSLALTAWSLIVQSTMAWWGALETLGLLCMALRTSAQPSRPVVAVAETVLISVTVLLLPLRIGSWQAFNSGGYVLIIALAISITLGYTIRALEARRERTAREVRYGERLALARDLHDLIAHHMTGIIVQANAALSIQATAPDKIEPILRNIAQAGAETLESTRRLVRVLREESNTPLRPGDLLTDLGELVSAHCAAASPGSGPAEADTARLEATAAARVARLRPEVQTSAHRLVQEALTNVRRHAPDAHTIVRLDADTERLRVTVTNTPPHRRALIPAGGRGDFGLLGLQERIEALDGTLRAGPLPDGGWEVSAALPLAPS